MAGAKQARSKHPGKRGVSGASLLLWAVAAVLAAGLGALIVWGGGHGPKADPDDPAQVALGKKVYDAHCARCHGANLKGQPDWQRPGPSGKLPAPPHDATGHTWHHTDRQLFEVTKFGTKIFASSDYRTDMTGFGDKLGDREIWAVLAYIKSRWPADIRARQRQITERSEQ
ncbi:MAG TPA: cytochrome c [Alphaproteobacteria bacterium]|jgi:mono/diheme cytochrome c family protein|nr:cytochrome c [Alphaproteobacteria bacterium]